MNLIFMFIVVPEDISVEKKPRFSILLRAEGAFQGLNPLILMLMDYLEDLQL